MAESYAAVAEPAYFARAADDLVSAVAPRRGERFLDLGSGTGAVLHAARRATGGDATLVAADPAVAMLDVARRRATRGLAVAAALPLLPFRPESFDAVAAAFVLSHVADVERSLRAIADVLVRGGRIGLASWGESPAASPPARVWQEVMERFIEREAVSDALGEALPSETALAARATLESLLNANGFDGATSAVRAYDVSVSTDAFVQLRLLSFPCRFMRTTLVRDRWTDFVTEATEMLRGRFGDRIEFSVKVNIATATRA